MTRPATLSQVAERVLAGAPYDAPLAEFVDAFLAAPTPEARLAMLMEEPPLTAHATGDGRVDALLGAVGEYLSKQFRLSCVPPWVGAKVRVLDEPWWTTTSDAPGMREYLSWGSPAEFIHHNIFTDPTPLRRAGWPTR